MFTDGKIKNDKCSKMKTNIQDGIDIEESLKELKKLADQDNHIQSIEALGLLYGWGHYIPRDFKKGKSYFDKAISVSDDDSYYRFLLAKLYFREGEIAQSLDAFKELSTEKYTPAMFQLSVIYSQKTLNGEPNSNYDNEKSLSLVKEAAELGHIYSIGYYIRRILGREYGWFALIKVPMLLATAIYRLLILYDRPDPEGNLVK